MRPFAIYDTVTGDIRMAGFQENGNARQFVREGEGLWSTDSEGFVPPKKGAHRVDVNTGEIVNKSDGERADLAPSTLAGG